MRELERIKLTIFTALICSGLGFAAAAFSGGILVLLLEAIAPELFEEDLNLPVMLGWSMFWTSIVTMAWVKTNGLPSDD